MELNAERFSNTAALYFSLDIGRGFYHRIVNGLDNITGLQPCHCRRTALQYAHN